MYCKNCGAELKEEVTFCSKCGYRLDKKEDKEKEVSEDEPVDEEDDESSGGLPLPGIIIAIIAVAIICFVGALIKKSMSDSQSETSAEEQNEKAGTQFNNLGYQCGVSYGESDGVMRYDTGRVTYAEETLYYYERDGIYAINEAGERTQICMADSASSLNVNGQYLYFLEGSDIYRVNKEGGEKEKILSAESNLPFFIYDDIIYYIVTEQITDTEKYFYILGYDVDKEKEVAHINMGEKQPRIVEVAGDGLITIYYLESREEDTEHASQENRCYELRRIDMDGDTICSREFHLNGVRWSSTAELLVFRSVNSIYTTQEYTDVLNVINPEQFYDRAVVETGTDFLIFKNTYKDDLIATYDNYTLYLIPEELLTSFDSKSPLIKEIVYERHEIDEVYVIGDYVYYTVVEDYWEGNDYGSTNLYRIKVDGAEREDI